MDGWMVGCSLNTGVNTGLVSTSNTPKITEGGGRVWRCSFEALSFSLSIFNPFFHPCNPPTSSHSLCFRTLHPPNPALFPFSLMYGCSRFHFDDGQSLCVCVCFCNWQRSDGLCQWQHMACVSDTDYCVMFQTVCVIDWQWCSQSAWCQLSLWMGGFFSLSSFLNNNEVSRLF